MARGKAGGGTAQADQLIKVKGMDKQQLCVDLLMVGCVQSFVDFFHITHRKAAPVDGHTEQAPGDVEIPEQTLVFLKETLETAEGAHRAENYKDCFESYGTLAEYFEKVPDLKSGMYFHQRCADVATEVDARDSIAKANLSLGSCEEQAGNLHAMQALKEKVCRVASSYKMAMDGPDTADEEAKSFELPDGKIIQVNQQIRLGAPEVLFGGRVPASPVSQKGAFVHFASEGSRL